VMSQSRTANRGRSRPGVTTRWKRGSRMPNHRSGTWGQLDHWNGGGDITQEQQRQEPVGSITPPRSQPGRSPAPLLLIVRLKLPHGRCAGRCAPRSPRIDDGLLAPRVQALSPFGHVPLLDPQRKRGGPRGAPDRNRSPVVACCDLPVQGRNRNRGQKILASRRWLQIG
jgi:hypothetical protein